MSAEDIRRQALPRLEGSQDDEAPVFLFDADGGGELRYDYTVEQGKVGRWLSITFQGVTSCELLPGPLREDDSFLESRLQRERAEFVVSLPGWGAYKIAGSLGACGAVGGTRVASVEVGDCCLKETLNRAAE